MNRSFYRRLASLALMALLSPLLAGAELPEPAAHESAAWYQFSAPSRDGIGKYYMGREISHVMGHQGADWLERPVRERDERTDLLVAELPLARTDVVADIGAGTGYFVFRLSPLLPEGKVMAVDIQQEMLDFVEGSKKLKKIANVEPLLGTIAQPALGRLQE